MPMRVGAGDANCLDQRLAITAITDARGGFALVRGLAWRMVVNVHVVSR